MSMRFDLKKLLFEKGITGTELADSLNLPKVVIFNLIHNKVLKVDLEVLNKICDFLECEVNELIVKNKIDQRSRSEKKTYVDVLKNDNDTMIARTEGTIHHFVHKTININTIRIFLRAVQLFGDLEESKFKEKTLKMFKDQRNGLQKNEVQEKGLNVYGKRRMIFEYVLAELKREDYIQMSINKPNHSASLTEKGKNFLKQFQ